MKRAMLAACLCLSVLLRPAHAGEAGVNTWKVVAEDKRSRYWSGAVWDGENKGVHAWGGLTNHNDVENFDPAKGAWVQQYKPDPRSGSSHKQWSYLPKLGWLKSGRPAVHCFVWDQLAYDSSRKKVFYFLAGRTLAYDVGAKTWQDMKPKSSPPPVSWGALAFDSVKREILLFGGGGVYEGRPGMWAYSPDGNVWKPVKTKELPPARCCSPLAVDVKNKALVLFGGDAQDRLLADTWIFDLEKREWRESKSKLHPGARGGHGLAWEPKSGLVILARGYQGIARGGSGGRRGGLSNETWAYDVKSGRWRRLKADMPSLIAPRTWPRISETMAAFPGGVVLLHNQTSGYGKPMARKTAVLKFDLNSDPFMSDTAALAAQQKKKPARPRYSANKPPEVPAEHQAKAAARLKSLAVNTWTRAMPLKETEFNAFGNMHFDYAGERAVYWGGGHSTHQLNHLTFYDPALNTWWDCWAPESMPPPHQAENGCRGMTLKSRPWNVHTGKSYYSWDSIDKVMVYGGRQWQATAPAGSFKIPWKRDRYSGYHRAIMGYIDPDTTKFTEVEVRRGGQLVNTSGRVMTLWGPTRKSRVCREVGIFLPRAGKWKVAKIAGEFQSGTLVYDSDRKLLLSIVGGTVYELDPETGKASSKTAKGKLPKIRWSGGEVYIPRHKTVIFGARCVGGDQLWAYSVKKNEFKQVKVKGPKLHYGLGCNHSGPLVYSPKHDVLISMSGRGRTYLMRFVPR
jgi:Galactose oxidase, central domain